MKSRLLMRAGVTVRFCDPASSIGGVPIVLAARVSVRRPDDESRAIIGGWLVRACDVGGTGVALRFSTRVMKPLPQPSVVVAVDSLRW